MAHFVLEYSANLGLQQDHVQKLMEQLHTSAQQTGLFPLKGIRSRAYVCDQYRMADGNTHHGFAHLEVKVGAGRSLADRQAVAEQFFSVFTQFFDVHFEQRGMALSFELRELEPVLKFNKNNIQDYL